MARARRTTSGSRRTCRKRSLQRVGTPRGSTSIGTASNDPSSTSRADCSVRHLGLCNRAMKANLNWLKSLKRRDPKPERGASGATDPPEPQRACNKTLSAEAMGRVNASEHAAALAITVPCPNRQSPPAAYPRKSRLCDASTKSRVEHVPLCPPLASTAVDPAERACKMARPECVRSGGRVDSA